MSRLGHRRAEGSGAPPTPDEPGLRSPYNPETSAPRPTRDVILQDVTLRDGEQQAGVVFGTTDKVEIADALDRLGVDRIEAGRLDGAADEIETLRKVAGSGARAEIWAVSPADPAAVALAAEIGVHGVGIVVLATERYRRARNVTLDDCTRAALAAARAARAAGLQCTLLLADSPRLTPEELTPLLGAVGASWFCDGVALMDSYGLLVPEGMRRLVTTVRGATDLPIEVHAHNDFGLAVANSLAAVEAGASVVHASLIGLGERVGNTPLEEFVVAASVLAGLRHGVRLDELTSATDLVQRLSGVRVAANKPVIGAAFGRIESGVAAAAYARLRASGADERWMFPFTPRTVGGTDVEIVVGRSSGPANIEHFLRAEGIGLDADGRAELLRRARAVALGDRDVLTSEDLRALVGRLAAERIGWID